MKLVNMPATPDQPVEFYLGEKLLHRAESHIKEATFAVLFLVQIRWSITPEQGSTGGQGHFKDIRLCIPIMQDTPMVL